MEAMVTNAALSSVGNLQMAAMSLHDAVVASKKNDKTMLEIVNTICIRAPVIKRLLVQAIYSEDPDIDRAFARAINAVVHAMDSARMVVYEWLAKDHARRLFSAGDMQVALGEVLHVLDRNLDHIQALQVDDIQHRIMEMQQGNHQAVQRMNACATHVTSVMGQLENLLNSPGSTPADTIARAKITMRCKKDRASKGGCRLEWHQGYVLSVAWSPHRNRVATSSVDETAVLWDIITAQRICSLVGHKDYVGCIDWHPDGTLIATASDDMSASIWNANTGQHIGKLKWHFSDSVTSIAWSPDGSKLVTGSADRTAAVWNATTLERICVMEGHEGYVWAVTWSPDGSRVATASEDSTAVIWDAATGKQALTLTGHGGPVRAIAWSYDGTKLATASWDKTAALWEANTGKRIHSLDGHSDYVMSVDWSPDSSKVATASWDLTAMIWDVASLKHVHTLEGHTDNINCVVWSPDGGRVATASDDNTAAIWDVDME